MSLEGIVSKRLDAPYRSGRSDAFVKAKCANEQEFVVCGFVPSTVMPRAIGALVVGYYEGGKLIYAGRVGTGYTHAMARDLWKRLHPLERPQSPLDRIPKQERRRDEHWIEPQVVIEVHFRTWTADGLHSTGSFQGRAGRQAGSGGEAGAARRGRARRNNKRPRSKNRGRSHQSGGEKIQPLARSRDQGTVRKPEPRMAAQPKAGVSKKASSNPGTVSNPEHGAVHPSRSRLLGRRGRH